MNLRVKQFEDNLSILKLATLKLSCISPISCID